MEVIEYIKGEMVSVRRSIERVMKDMPDEIFNWATPGTANTISATFVHLMNSEDHFIQEVLQGKPTVWESRGWSEKTGIQKPPSIGEDWSEYKRRQIQIQPLMEYMAEVWAATDSYLASVTRDDLDRRLEFAGRERSVGDMLHLSIAQSYSHAGEIAALKGIQGIKGLPI
jgi:uncharacterized damage-inducible protein DinB